MSTLKLPCHTRRPKRKEHFCPGVYQIAKAIVLAEGGITPPSTPDIPEDIRKELSYLQGALFLARKEIVELREIKELEVPPPVMPVPPAKPFLSVRRQSRAYPVGSSLTPR